MFTVWSKQSYKHDSWKPNSQRMTIDAGTALLRALHDHNSWWEEGTEAFALPPRHKSDFYHLARPDESGSQFEDQPVLGIVGRRGVGKTTLLHQFVQHRIDSGAEAERFLYLPFDADPLYQLRSDEQLRRVVHYYESRILGRVDETDPHFVIIDDAHRIEHPTKPTIDGWATPVTELLDERSDRHVIVTTSSGVQVEREFDRVGYPEEKVDIQPILPETFRDHLYTAYPKLKGADRRIGPCSIRAGDDSLSAVIDGDDVDSLVSELRSKYERVADVERRIQSQVVDYLAMGGIISYERDGAVGSARELREEDYERLRETVRDALYQEVPGFETVQTISDLERLCALAARNRATEPVRYQDLVELFDVDRRTLADTYLPALEELYILTGVTEYDNSRPRSVRLFLRDTGLVTALAKGDASTVYNNFEREAELARVAAFDHTMRLADSVTTARGHNVEPSVQYWRGRAGEVDFVFEVGETPVPIGLGYRPRERAAVVEAVQEFRSEYDAPVGFVVIGDTIRGIEPVEEVSEGVVQLPYWLYLLLC